MSVVCLRGLVATIEGFLQRHAARGGLGLVLGLACALGPAQAGTNDTPGDGLAAAFDTLLQRASLAPRASGSFQVSGRDILVGGHRLRVTPRRAGSSATSKDLKIVGLQFDVMLDGKAQPALQHETLGIALSAEEAERLAMIDWVGQFGQPLLHELDGGRPVLRTRDLAVHAGELSLRNGSAALAADALLSAERMLQVLQPVLPPARAGLQAVHVNVDREPGGGLKTKVVINGARSDAGSRLLAAQAWPAAPATQVGAWYMASRSFVLVPVADKGVFFEEQRLQDAFERVMRSWSRDPMISIAYDVDGRDLVVEGRRVRVTPTLERLRPGSGGQAFAEMRFDVAVDGQAQPRLRQVLQTVHPDASMAQAQLLANWYAEVGQTILAAASARKPELTVGSLGVYPGFTGFRSPPPAPRSNDPAFAPARIIEALAAQLPAADGTLHAVHVELFVPPSGDVMAQARINGVVSREAAARLVALAWPRGASAYLMSRTFTLR